METGANLVEVFTSYDGNVIFRGLTDSTGGSGAALGRVGWIFTGLGAFFLLWGFMLRSQRAGSGERVAEIARTWVLAAGMLAAPLMMRTAMATADGLYETTLGGPRMLALACVRAAYALPNPLTLFSPVRNAAPAAATSPAPSDDGTLMGASEAFLADAWQEVKGLADAAKGVVGQAFQVAAMVSGFVASTLRAILVLLAFVPLYLLFLASSGVIWFMAQLRFLLAVVGTMMAPLFIGMLSLPEGHPNRQAAQAYLTNLLSLTLWPVAWMLGHTGTIVLFDALASLIAGSGRAPDLQATLTWASLSQPLTLTDAQLRAQEVALGNWFMGNVASLMAVVVGVIGFVIWVFTVTIAGPVLLHRMLTTGALYFSQALATTRQYAVSAASTALPLAARMGPLAPSLAAPLPGAVSPENFPAAAAVPVVAPSAGAASLAAASGCPG